MKSATVAFVLIVTCALVQPSRSFARGSHGGGHGHGGGHSGGGHASGGHSGGGHSSGGHSSGAHSGGGRSSGAHSGDGHSSGGGHAAGRPHGGRTIVGTAIPRTSPRPAVVIAPNVYSPFGSGLHYGASLRFNAFRRYGYPMFYDYGYGVSDYEYDYGLPYAAPYATAPYPFPVDDQIATGGLRLRIEPKSADVFVDGYYAGIVDDFNGHFQRLKLVAGPHHVEIVAAGYAPLTFDVIIEPHHTTEFQAVLQR
jgi:hypothetical protein